MSFGGGGGSQKIDNRPFADDQARLQILIAQQGEDLLNQGPQQYFPGDLTPDLSQNTIKALNLAGQRAYDGLTPTQAQNFATSAVGGQSQLPALAGGNFSSNPQMQAAYSGLQQMGGGGGPLSSFVDGPSPLDRTASGEYLSSNPYLQDTFDRASRAVTDTYKKSTVPGIDSRFAAGGRVGSGYHAAALRDANYGLGENLGNLATDIFGGDYQQERGRQVAAQSQIANNRLSAAQGLAGNQLSAFGQLGGLADAQAGRQLGATGQQLQAAALQPAFDASARGDVATGLQAGAVMDRQNVATAQEEFDRFMFNQNAPYDQLGRLLPLGGAAGTTTTQPGGSPLAGALGGSLGTAGVLGSAGLLSGPAAMNPFGAGALILGGGLLGGLG